MCFPHDNLIYLGVGSDVLDSCERDVLNRRKVRILCNPELVLAENAVFGPVHAQPNTVGVEAPDR